MYALNESYHLSEKKLEADFEAFRIQPENFLARIAGILGATGTTGERLQESLAKTEAIYKEVAVADKEIVGEESCRGLGVQPLEVGWGELFKGILL